MVMSDITTKTNYMRYLFGIGTLITIMLLACEVSVKKGDDKEATKTKTRNGINIKSKGIKVEQAFLLFEDGNLVPEDNKVRINQKVRMRLILSGWKEKEGKVFLSAAETVKTSEGDIILDERDLFKGYEQGLSPDDAKFITLNVVITEINKLYDHFMVSFQLKDQTEPQNTVEGYYKLYIE